MSEEKNVESLNLRTLIFEEILELFRFKILVSSLIFGTIISLVLYRPLMLDRLNVISFLSVLIDISGNLLAISIAYVTFVVTLIFTVWNKDKLLNVRRNSSETYRQIFSPYVLIIPFIAMYLFFVVFAKFYLKSCEDEIITVSFLWLSIWGMSHIVIYTLDTIMLFIKDMTIYTDINDQQ